MGIIGYLILVIVVGVLVWAAVQFVPMPAQFKVFLPTVAIVLLVLLLLAVMLGLGVHDVPIPRLR